MIKYTKSILLYVDGNKNIPIPSSADNEMGPSSLVRDKIILRSQMKQKNIIIENNNQSHMISKFGRTNPKEIY